MLQLVETLELKSNDALVHDVKELGRDALVIAEVERLEGLHCIADQGRLGALVAERRRVGKVRVVFFVEEVARHERCRANFRRH